MLAIVTVKKEKAPDYDPSNKRTGPDPFTYICTDYMGEDHSVLAWGKNEIEIAGKIHEMGYQIERIEVVTKVLGLTLDKDDRTLKELAK